MQRFKNLFLLTSILTIFIFNTFVAEGARLSSVAKRFIKYAKIDTASKEDVKKIPSTRGQCRLADILVAELKRIGIYNAKKSAHCYVTGTLKSNLKSSEAKKVPKIGFIAHLDTTPEISAKKTQPKVHYKYDGKSLILDKSKNIVLRTSENSYLSNCINKTLITGNGKAILGADDKVAIAEIINALEKLKKGRKIKHGDVGVFFSPDEEVWRGLEKINLRSLREKRAYVVEAGKIGNIIHGNFAGAKAIFKIKGQKAHPGYAKGKLANAIKVASRIISSIDKKDLSPENVDGDMGYLYVYKTPAMTVDYAEIHVLLRDFKEKGLSEKKKYLQRINNYYSKKFKRADIKLEIFDQFQNIEKYFKDDPRLINYTQVACLDLGIKPNLVKYRGGTSASYLNAAGILTLGIGSGAMNSHSVREYVCVEDMEKVVDELVNIAKIWADNSLTESTKHKIQMTK